MKLRFIMSLLRCLEFAGWSLIMLLDDSHVGHEGHHQTLQPVEVGGDVRHRYGAPSLRAGEGLCAGPEPRSESLQCSGGAGEGGADCEAPST